ncbi:hypothetical protein H4R34_001913 [Dimargaris verticillata]|uniref:Uncharacterized protein n=1 Tax=Dimargaris verticillata TaxID=2761393 RepID=A0A9W8B561_9FUNG|nr:hypothetical protein H4R34_001913 [Dimargaris verticillata]
MSSVISWLESPIAGQKCPVCKSTVTPNRLQFLFHDWDEVGLYVRNMDSDDDNEDVESANEIQNALQIKDRCIAALKERCEKIHADAKDNAGQYNGYLSEFKQREKKLSAKCLALESECAKLRALYSQALASTGQPTNASLAQQCQAMHRDDLIQAVISAKHFLDQSDTEIKDTKRKLQAAEALVKSMRDQLEMVKGHMRAQKAKMDILSHEYEMSKASRAHSVRSELRNPDAKSNVWGQRRQKEASSSTFQPLPTSPTIQSPRQISAHRLDSPSGSSKVPNPFAIGSSNQAFSQPQSPTPSVISIGQLSKDPESETDSATTKAAESPRLLHISDTELPQPLDAVETMAVNPLLLSRTRPKRKSATNFVQIGSPKRAKSFSAAFADGQHTSCSGGMGGHSTASFHETRRRLQQLKDPTSIEATVTRLALAHATSPRRSGASTSRRQASSTNLKQKTLSNALPYMWSK